MIGARHLIGVKYLIRLGREASKKMPVGTLSQVFSEARKLAVKHAPK